jgi:hypothetical protein
MGFYTMVFSYLYVRSFGTKRSHAKTAPHGWIQASSGETKVFSRRSPKKPGAHFMQVAEKKASVRTP